VGGFVGVWVSVGVVGGQEKMGHGRIIIMIIMIMVIIIPPTHKHKHKHTQIPPPPFSLKQKQNNQNNTTNQYDVYNAGPLPAKSITVDDSAMLAGLRVLEGSAVLDFGALPP
jgi:hypothetical protein